MSLVTPTTTGQPMSWQEYEVLAEDSRVEYVDGRALVSPSPSRVHQTICRRLANVLEAALLADGTLAVTEGWAWRPQGQPDEYIPDVLVHPRTEESARFTGTPLLVVEVLSTHRSGDLVLKAGKYACAGLPHYWVVDPRDRVLDAYLLGDGLYRLDARVTEATGPATVRLGQVALDVDLTALLRS